MKKDIIIFTVLWLFLAHNTYSYTPNIEQINNVILLQEEGIIGSKSSSSQKIQEYKKLEQSVAQIQSINPDLVDQLVREIKLWDSITRREIIKVVMNMSWINIKENCIWKFNDILKSDWGCKYIEAALEMWVITHGEEFRPNDNISKVEALKLILKAKWIEKTIESNNWQSDYVTTALHYDIINETFIDYNTSPNRAWIFDIVAAVLIQEEEIKIKQSWLDSAPEIKLVSDESL